jgi:chemotaxis methyl-accepting protein methylase
MPGLTMEEEAIRPELTPGERDLWRDEVERRCGICFSDSRLYVLRTALLLGMRRRGIETYREYCGAVMRSPDEWDRLLEAILNRETSFFRHPPSFEALSFELLPRLAAARRKRGGGALTLWSAGCSSGEEAYSMAIAAREALSPSFDRYEVLGSDLSAEALAASRRARYSVRAVEEVPERLRGRYFTRDGSGYAVDPVIRATVRFERINFIDPATYPAWPQDVIFCQNVLIYFREPVRAQVAARLGGCLGPGGYLVCGPGELAGVRVPGLEYQRTEQAGVLRRE